jgi:aminopeptidase
MTFDGREYFRERNERAEAEYCEAIEKIVQIQQDREGSDNHFGRFFRHLSSWIIALADLEERLSEDYFEHTGFDKLMSENDRLFKDIEPDTYTSGYADPAFSVSIFGDGYGQLLSAFYSRYRTLIRYVFQHRRYRISDECRLFLEVEELFGQDDPPPYETLKRAVTRIDVSDSTERHTDHYREMLDPGFRFYRDISGAADPSDLRYLFRYGCRISEHVLRTAGFIAGCSSELIEGLAESVVDAYIRGFEADGKAIDRRRVVSVTAPAGYEPVVNRIASVLERLDMVPLIRSPIIRPVNRQYTNDHRFDYVLYMDEEVSTLHSTSIRAAIEGLSDLCDLFSGRIIFLQFGEEPFSPLQKSECLKPDTELAALWRRFLSENARTLFASLPRSETSFSAIAFPSPDIRGNFEQIFRDTLEINTLDSGKYERIQQEIINVLDTAAHIRIRGSAGNRTDLQVCLQPILDPSKETNFLNCIDTVNIPLGEVFTSPRLHGTNGILHVEEAYLDGLRYTDLGLTFRDGYVVDYGCSNFDSSEENRRYIHENLLFPHDSLPMGEFAIGSNTHAYAMAKRHGIMDLLPVLIIEKMGPHFAIGDTCFSNEEDHPVHNRLDGKEVIARDNELSRLRKENPDTAYTDKHTDVTLPYSSLDSISAVQSSGKEVFIIRGGRFVLPGTEELNDPIDLVDEDDASV